MWHLDFLWFPSSIRARPQYALRTVYFQFWRGPRRVAHPTFLRSQARAYNRHVNRDRVTIQWNFTRKLARKKFGYSITRSRYLDFFDHTSTEIQHYVAFIAVDEARASAALLAHDVARRFSFHLQPVRRPLENRCTRSPALILPNTLIGQVC